MSVAVWNHNIWVAGGERLRLGCSFLSCLLDSQFHGWKGKIICKRLKYRTAKVYAAWDAETVEGATELGRWAAEHPLLQATTHIIFGHEVVHVTIRKPIPNRIQTFVHLVTPPGLAMLRESIRHRVRVWRRRQWN
jgi:hypothetical protein